jgi:TRAP transporter TAXI family solute receptor
VPTKGTGDNVPKLEAGDIDLGLVSGEVAHELFAGLGRPVTKLTVISVMYSTPGLFIVRADSRYRRIADLKGRPVVWNGRGSCLAVQARYVMDGLGLDIDKDFEPIYPDNLTKAADGARRPSCGAVGQQCPLASFVKVTSSTRGGRFVVPTAAEIQRIHEKHSFLTRLTVRPASIRPVQRDRNRRRLELHLARADLGDALGHRLAASLYKLGRAGTLSRQLMKRRQRTLCLQFQGRRCCNPALRGSTRKWNC